MTFELPGTGHFTVHDWAFVNFGSYILPSGEVFVTSYENGLRGQTMSGPGKLGVIRVKPDGGRDRGFGSHGTVSFVGTKFTDAVVGALTSRPNGEVWVVALAATDPLNYGYTSILARYDSRGRLIRTGAGEIGEPTPPLPVCVTGPGCFKFIGTQLLEYASWCSPDGPFGFDLGAQRLNVKY